MSEYIDVNTLPDEPVLALCEDADGNLSPRWVTRQGCGFHRSLPFLAWDDTDMRPVALLAPVGENDAPDWRPLTDDMHKHPKRLVGVRVRNVWVGVTREGGVGTVTEGHSAWTTEGGYIGDLRAGDWSYDPSTLPEGYSEKEDS